MTPHDRRSPMRHDCNSYARMLVIYLYDPYAGISIAWLPYYASIVLTLMIYIGRCRLTRLHNWITRTLPLITNGCNICSIVRAP